MVLEDGERISTNTLLGLRIVKPNPVLPAHPAVAVATKALQLAGVMATVATADHPREEIRDRSLSTTFVSQRLLLIS